MLDQFPRHVYRGTPGAYASDAKAQRLACEGIEARVDEELTLSERHFFYLPLMHAEDPALQAKSVERFTALRDAAEQVLAFAREHRDVVARFGRFPYRNAVLGRPSTPRKPLTSRRTRTRSADDWSAPRVSSNAFVATRTR